MGKKALCVGINNFKNFPQYALQGCINDSKDMASILKEFQGYTDTEITFLNDAQATKEGILNALKEMVAGAKNGKYQNLVFSLSSHGTQMPDLDHDEADYYDEAICPYDLAQGVDNWDRNHIIVDDDLREILASLPQDVLMEVFIDTCHSGTILRAMDLPVTCQPRFIPPVSVRAMNAILQQKPRPVLKVTKNMPNLILWAACKSSQTSADAKINDTWHGAFTYYFCKEIRDYQNQLTRAEILKKILADLKAGHYTQKPQLECNSTLKNAVIS